MTDNQKSHKRYNLDPVANLQNVFASMFRHVFPNASARSFLGFNGLSERVLNPEGWYIFPEKHPGVYGLELIEAQEFNPGDAKIKPGSIGTFLIKYYPALNEDLLAYFSQIEQQARSSEFFDATGSPTLDAEALIHDALFSIGTIDVLCNSERIELSLNVLETDRQTSTLPAPDSITHKDIPAWQLAWDIFDPLVTGLCYFWKTNPREAVLFQRNSTSDAQNDRCLSLSFDVPGTKQPVLEEKGIFISHLENMAATGHGRMLACFSPETQSEWINGQWWLSRQYPISDSGIDFID